MPTDTPSLTGNTAPDTTTSVENTDATHENEAADIDLADLVSSEYDDHPELKGGHRGLPDYKKILEHLPENGRKLVGNLRASYTQKTQELSVMRAQLEQERQTLANERALLSESEFTRTVKAQAEAPLQHDPWSDEGLQERIDKRAAEMMQKMLSPLQQDLEAQRMKVSLESFKAQHPDLTSDEVRVPVARLLMERPELKLQDAYFIVTGQLTRQQSESVKQTQRDTLKKTSTGNAVRNAAPPKFRDAYQAYMWHKANGVK